MSAFEIGRILGFHRQSLRRSPVDVVDRVNGLAPRAQNQFLGWLFYRSRFKQGKLDQIERRIRAVEKGVMAPLTNDFFVLLCSVYDISPSLVYPFFCSEQVDLPLDPTFRQFKRMPRKMDPGEPGCTYSFPPARISNCDCVVVHLRLDKNAQTRTHFHDGEELVFVLTGEAEVLMPEMGYCCRPLIAHEYAHFHSDSLHSIKNASDTEPCELLIFRFNQVSGGFRQVTRTQLDEFEKALTRNQLSRAKDLFASAIGPWLRGTLPAANRGKVANPQGLSSFLKILMEEHDLNLHQIVKEMKGTISRRKLEQLFYCVPNDALTRENVGLLAKATNTPEAFFHTYFYPRINAWLAVREREFVRVPLMGEKGQIGNYKVPVRHLSASDSSVNIIEIDSNSPPACKSKHPGTEFIIPLSGSGELHFPTGTQPIHLDSDQYRIACFKSTIDHEIRSVGNAQFRALVVRIYGTNAK